VIFSGASKSGVDPENSHYKIFCNVAKTTVVLSCHEVLSLDDVLTNKYHSPPSDTNEYSGIM